MHINLKIRHNECFRALTRVFFTEGKIIIRKGGGEDNNFDVKYTPL